MIKNNQKITAIKKLRSKFKLSLKQAKEIIEEESNVMKSVTAFKKAPAKVKKILSDNKLKVDIKTELLALNDKLKNSFTPHAALGCFGIIFSIVLGLILGGIIFQGPVGAVVVAFIFAFFGFAFFGLTLMWGAKSFFNKEIMPKLENIMRKQKLTLEQLATVADEVLPNSSAPLREQIRKLLYKDSF